MNSFSPEVIAQLFAQESTDPFLILVTLSHDDWPDDVRLVQNGEDVESRGQNYMAFPVSIKLPTDDGESTPQVGIDFDNVSLELITQIRSVTDAIGVKLEMILASMPDEVQMSLEDMYLQSVTYDRTKISARIILDNFLNTEMTSEYYTPLLFPGLF